MTEKLTIVESVHLGDAQIIINQLKEIEKMVDDPVQLEDMSMQMLIDEIKKVLHVCEKLNDSNPRNTDS